MTPRRPATVVASVLAGASLLASASTASAQSTFFDESAPRAVDWSVTPDPGDVTEVVAGFLSKNRRVDLGRGRGRKRRGKKKPGNVRPPAEPAQAASPDPLITELQPWQQYLGDGVDARPYGTPSKFEAQVSAGNIGAKPAQLQTFGFEK